MIKKRKIPLRICIGCQEKKAKKELVRIVRTPEGTVILDLTGKKAGRGAYLCPCEACLHKAVKGKRLEKNLQQAVSEELLNDIAKAMQELKEDV